MDKWKLYDRLIAGVPEGPVLEECFVGDTWTMVRSGHNWGISMTVHQSAGPEEPGR